jgi:uncharacterized membrane protein/protein-disulfide isomerase
LQNNIIYYLNNIISFFVYTNLLSKLIIIQLFNCFVLCMNNYITTFLKFIRLAKIKLSNSSAISELEKQAEQNSLLGYVSVLEKYNVETVAVKVSKERLNDLPVPFISFLSRNGGSFNIVRDISNDTVEWFDTNSNWKKSRKDKFLEEWSGIALLAEPSETSGEAGYINKRIAELFDKNKEGLIGVLLSVFLLRISFLLEATIEDNFLLGLNLVGLFLCYSIWRESIGYKSDLSEILCSSGASDNSCQSLLSGKGANFLDIISYADLGLIYFSTNIVFSFSSFCNKEVFGDAFVAWISGSTLLGVFFSLWSVYYQKFVAKVWCKLCLSVMAVFWVQLVIVTFFSFLSFTKEMPLGFSFAFLFSILPISILYLVKPEFRKAVHAKSFEQKLNKLRRNKTVIQGLFNDQPIMPELPVKLDRVIMGSPYDSSIRITMVSNPLCSPCAEMHRRLKDLIMDNRNISLEVIFITSENKKNAGRRFLNALLRMNDDSRDPALRDWYRFNDRNYEKWALGRLIESSLSEQEADDILEKYREWANKAGVKSTPSLFINGMLLPESIEIEEAVKLDLDMIK